MYKKIDKTKARNWYNKGRDIYILPNKTRFDFNATWIKPTKISINEDWCKNDTFDSIVNSYSYYNCNNEMGNRPAYYIEIEDK